MSTTYDNWERLVAATLKREQFRQLALAHSRESSLSSIQSDFSFDSPLYSGPDGSRFPNNMCNSSAPSNISVPFSSVESSADGLPPPRSEGDILSSPYLKAFSFNELKNATRNFQFYLNGEGGFGNVFKGWIDEHTLTATKPGSGLVVAVKKWNIEGFTGHREWLTEVNYLSQHRHTQLVKLIGYCSEADNRLLVYEFMPRGSLDNHLFTTRVDATLSTPPRYCNYSHRSKKLPLFSMDVSRLPNMCNSSAHSNISIPFSSVKSFAASLPTPRAEAEILSPPYVKAFSFNELKSATRNFRPDSFLGEGGFGFGFKGWIDEHTLTATKPGSGLVITVKKLKPEGFQGHKEWSTEVNYLGQLHHTNLVKLIGYCSEADNRLLVYEFMPSGSLENLLFRRGPQPLSWAIRMKVAIGAARGLSFLHEAEEQVIYRDFKASNILLDGEFNAKLSDFGLAKAGPKGDKTHTTTEVIGTRGYAAPEYVATGRLSAKSDVYSFGVVLLELLSGRRAVDKTKVGIEQNLVEWATPCMFDKRKLFRIMDTKMEGQYPQKAAFSVAAISLQCLCNEPKLRPRMAEVLATLEKLQARKSTRHSSADNQASFDMLYLSHHNIPLWV